jgi:gluconolactonase
MQMEVVAEGLLFPEGPVALADGRVLVTEIRGKTLAVCDPKSGAVTRVVSCGGGPNGAAMGPNGNIYVCNNGGSEWIESRGLFFPGLPAADYTNGAIQRVNLEAHTVDSLYDACGSNALSAPNDIVFDSSGGFWFTDTGKNRTRSRDHGGVYYARADGSSIDAALYPLTTPNGIALSPNGDELYVSETYTSRIWSWNVTAPGRVGKTGAGPLGARLVWGFDGYQLLDSMAVDADGNLCIATLIRGAISVVSPRGRLIEQIEIPGADPYITNICFGGIDRRTAFITSSGRGRLYAAKWPCPGLPLAY